MLGYTYMLYTLQIYAAEMYTSIFHFPTEPIEVLEPLKDVIVKERDTIVLECKISKSTVKYAWLKDGKPLKGTSRAETKHDGQIHRLTISNSELSDIGRYSVSFNDDDCVLEANVDIKGTLFVICMLTCTYLSSLNISSALFETLKICSYISKMGGHTTICLLTSRIFWILSKIYYFRFPYHCSATRHTMMSN